MSTQEAKTARAEASKNIITCDVTKDHTVRVYIKTRAKGEIKWSKKRVTHSFSSSAQANTELDNLYISKGAKIRKVEVINGEDIQSFRPVKIRLTPTREQREEAKALKRAEREAQRTEKAAAKTAEREAKVKAKADTAKKTEAAKKAEAVAKAKAKTQAATKKQVEKALA